MNDSELLDRFKNSESRNWAFDQIIKRYQKEIYYLIRRMVVEHEDADDLTQTVFIKLWKNLDRFQEKSSLKTWIYRIATNEALSFLRKKKRVLFLPLKNLEAELIEKLHTHSELIEGDEIQFKLQEAILKLPERQRVVFELRYFEEMSYEEISQIIPVSIGALKASYHHAVKKVERSYKNKGKPLTNEEARVF